MKNTWERRSRHTTPLVVFLFALFRIYSNFAFARLFLRSHLRISFEWQLSAVQVAAVRVLKNAIMLHESEVSLTNDVLYFRNRASP